MVEQKIEFYENLCYILAQTPQNLELFLISKNLNQSGVNYSRVGKTGIVMTVALTLAMLISPVLLSSPVYAATEVIWDGGGDGMSFDDPLNWSTDSLPASSDSIVIDNKAVTASKVHLDVNFTLTGSITIKALDSLVVDNGVHLVIASGAEFTTDDVGGVGTLENFGTIDNSGTIFNRGILNNTGAQSVINNFGAIANPGTITARCSSINNSGTIYGNPINTDCTHEPVIYMQDTTASFGLSTHEGRPLHAEYVSPASQLVGDRIDQITLKLRKSGTPSGVATVGVFRWSSDGPVLKKVFNTIDVSTLTLTYSDYSFQLPAGEVYEIRPYDRIGMYYEDGNIANFVAVMTDQSSSDPFDGSNTFYNYYTTQSYSSFYTPGWQSAPMKDLYMILTNTN
jgi:hypothetical protein